MTEPTLKRALYLRPESLGMTGLDDAVKAWLRAEGFEPVDEAPYEVVAYLPYDGGGNYYHADVRSYDDLMRAYAERRASLTAASTRSTASGCVDRPSPYIAHVM